MRKLLLLLVLLAGAFSAHAQFLPIPATRITSGAGAPSGALCASAGDVNKVYVRNNLGAATSPLYICGNTGASTYAWVSSAGAGGTGCTVSGSATQVLTDDGAGACVSNPALLYTGGILTIGTSGSLVGELDLVNATTGVIKIKPTTGALGTITLTLPAFTGTFVVAATSTTTTQALFATATGGAPAYRAIAAADLPSTLSSGTAITNAALTTPAIASFVNATHNHTNAAGGGQLTDSALSAAIGIAKGGTGQVTQQAAYDALAPTATRAGDITYWNGTHYVNLAGNNSGTKFLSQDASGVPSWASGGSGSGDVVGPSSATDNCFVRFDGTTGKLIKDCTGALLDNSGNASFLTVATGTSPPSISGGTAGAEAYSEGTVPTVGAATGVCVLYADSSAHGFKASCNNGSYVNMLTSAGLASIASGKVFTSSNTWTATASDGSTVAFGSGGTVLYNGGAAGTPSSITLTSATGLPPAGVTAAQGNGTKFQFSTGTTTTGNCAQFDSNGNTVDAGIACLGGGTSTKTADYTTVAGDSGKLILGNGSSITLSLLATPGASYAVGFENIHSTDLVISRNGLTINGASSNITLKQYQQVACFSNGTNYFCSVPDVAGSGITLTQAANGQTIALTTASRYRVCDIAIGDTTGSAITNAQLGPQSRVCFIPASATIVEVDVNADDGTPNIIIGRNRAGSIVNILSGALATAASGGIACSNTGGTTGINGATTCSSTLQNTSLNAGDYLEAVSGTAGGTAKFFVVHIIYTI